MHATVTPAATGGRLPDLDTRINRKYNEGGKMMPFWIDASLESLPEIFVLFTSGLVFVFTMLTGSRSGV